MDSTTAYRATQFPHEEGGQGTKHIKQKHRLNQTFDWLVGGTVLRKTTELHQLQLARRWPTVASPERPSHLTDEAVCYGYTSPKLHQTSDEINLTAPFGGSEAHRQPGEGEGASAAPLHRSRPEVPRRDPEVSDALGLTPNRVFGRGSRVRWRAASKNPLGKKEVMRTTGFITTPRISHVF